QKYHRYEKYMSYDACALGAMFALSASELPKDKETKYWDWARGITNTCVQAANGTDTKLAPHRFYFDYRDEEEVNIVDSGRNALRYFKDFSNANTRIILPGLSKGIAILRTVICIFRQ